MNSRRIIRSPRRRGRAATAVHQARVPCGSAKSQREIISGLFERAGLSSHRCATLLRAPDRTEPAGPDQNQDIGCPYTLDCLVGVQHCASHLAMTVTARSTEAVTAFMTYLHTLI